MIMLVEEEVVVVQLKGVGCHSEGECVVGDLMVGIVLQWLRHRAIAIRGALVVVDERLCCVHCICLNLQASHVDLS
jgi:hypothetical protein